MSEGPIGRMDLVGVGRVGSALRSRLAATGRLGVVLTRAEGQLDPAVRRPILVCTRNDDLDGVLDRVPSARRRDLVFVQNGMLRPWIEAAGLEDVTRGLLFFAVPTLGDDLSLGPDPSPFTGRWAPDVVEALEHAGVEARVVDGETFRTSELEKLVWNCAFGLLCEAFDDTVGGVCVAHEDATRALCEELIAAGARALSVDVDEASMVDRLVAYSMSIPDYRGSVKEWRWRNGWFASLPAELPLHRRLLAQAGRDPETGALTSR